MRLNEKGMVLIKDGWVVVGVIMGVGVVVRIDLFSLKRVKTITKISNC